MCAEEGFRSTESAESSVQQSTVSGASLRLNGSSGRENFIVLAEDELHDLVLEDHVDGHVSGLYLGPEQSRTEDYGHALERHPVRIGVFNHPAGQGQEVQPKISTTS